MRMTEKLRFFEVKKLETLKEIEDYLFKHGYKESGITTNWKQGHGSQRWKTFIEDGNGVVFTVKSGNDYIGAITGFIINNIYNHNQIHCYINFIYVDPKWRGKGISTKLFNLIEKWGKSHNADYIITGVVNDLGSNFYKKRLGFRHLEEILIKNLKES